MSVFEAEVKRSYTIRESLRVARGGLLWTRGTVTLSDSYLRISTQGLSEDIRPHQVYWKSPVELSVRGVDRQGHLQRILLRLSNAQAAQSLIDTIAKRRTSVEIVSQPAAEEVPLFVRYRYPRPIVALSFTAVVVWIGLVIWGALLYGFFGAIFIVYFGSMLSRFALTPLILQFSGLVTGKLRREDGRIILASARGWYYPRFTVVRWNGPNEFVFKMGLKTVEIGFASADDAERAIRLIREKFPSVQDISL